MQGYNYAQLYAALQTWPLKSSAKYLADLNRIIYLGELRLIVDLDLDIFDVNDQVAVTAGAVSVPKPLGSQAVTFTTTLAQGAVSATLSAQWTGATGVYVVTFSDNEIQAVTFTQGATTATWNLPLVGAVSASGTINPQMVVERDLWSVYNGFTKLMVKRSYAFIQNYLGAAAGRPLYYCDSGTGQWLIAPSSDANTSAIKRRYVQRPVSIVAAGNTWLGDNVGQLLFTACLMESEMWLKADDRYGDMRTKYYQELLPNARGEIMVSVRAGVYAPIEPVASVAGGAAPQAAA